MLFALDSFGSGFFVQSMLALWLYQRFALSVATAAAIFFWASICSAVSFLIAVPVSKRFGLINTMVFTHLPANFFLMALPFAPNLPIAIALLLARGLLQQMDVPTRTSYVMAVVTPEERPAAASATAVPRSLAAAVSPLFAGYLFALSSFGWPLIIGGGLKVLYDVLLLVQGMRQLLEGERGRARLGGCRSDTKAAADRGDGGAGEKALQHGTAVETFIEQRAIALGEGVALGGTFASLQTVGHVTLRGNWSVVISRSEEARVTA